jgi:hypothetical protein
LSFKFLLYSFSDCVEAYAHLLVDIVFECVALTTFVELFYPSLVLVVLVERVGRGLSFQGIAAIGVEGLIAEI